MLTPFASATDLSAYTNGYISADDPRSLDALGGTSRAVRRYCGWDISPSEDVTLTVNGPGGYLLTLPSLYVTAVASITEAGVLLVEGADYRWSADGTIDRCGATWSAYKRDIVVVFTHGYDDAPDVKAVVLASVARNLASPVGATTEGSGGETVRWSQVGPGVAGGLALMPHELAILDTYKIARVS